MADDKAVQLWQRVRKIWKYLVTPTSMPLMKKAWTPGGLHKLQGPLNSVFHRTKGKVFMCTCLQRYPKEARVDVTFLFGRALTSASDRDEHDICA